MSIKYCVFSSKCCDFSELCQFCCNALVFYLPGACTHIDAEGKQRKVRVRNIYFKKSEKNTIYNEQPVGSKFFINNDPGEVKKIQNTLFFTFPAMPCQRPQQSLWLIRKINIHSVYWSLFHYICTNHIWKKVGILKRKKNRTDGKRIAEGRDRKRIAETDSKLIAKGFQKDRGRKNRLEGKIL